MNGMQECEFEGEHEKCPKYRAKNERQGHVNLICLWFLDNWTEEKGGAVCRLPPPKKGDEKC
jgi:hypothetical protein